MKFVSLVFISLLAMSQTGCMKTTKTLVNEVGTKWYGQPVKDFFLAHGAPASEYSVDSSTKMYQWSKGSRSLTMPATANTTIIGTQAFTTVSGGGTAHLSCSIEITTVDGLITRMVFSDTGGLWRLSRCDEVLNP